MTHPTDTDEVREDLLKSEKPPAIIIKVVSRTYNDLCFKVNMNTTFAKVRKEYAAFFGEDPADISLYFDGQLIHDTDTPSSIEMEHEDAASAYVSEPSYNVSRE